MSVVDEPLHTLTSQGLYATPFPVDTGLAPVSGPLSGSSGGGGTKSTSPVFVGGVVTEGIGMEATGLTGSGPEKTFQ